MSQIVALESLDILSFPYIDAFNTINLKLFPTYPNPPPVHDYEVPVCTVDLQKMVSVNWDLTIQKVNPGPRFVWRFVYLFQE